MKRSSFIGVSLVLALSAAASDASAARADRFRYQTASKDCQGALPAFAGTLRARPLGLGNEGDATAFVTCGFEGDGNFRNDTTDRLTLRVGNTSAVPVTISCTFVSGFGGMAGSAIYLPKTATIGPGFTQFLFWFHGEAGINLENAQVSCSLPPGAIIYHSFSFGTEEIGS